MTQRRRSRSPRRCPSPHLDRERRVLQRIEVGAERLPPSRRPLKAPGGGQDLQHLRVTPRREAGRDVERANQNREQQEIPCNAPRHRSSQEHNDQQLALHPEPQQRAMDRLVDRMGLDGSHQMNKPTMEPIPNTKKQPMMKFSVFSPT